MKKYGKSQITKLSEAIKAIVTLETLPHQIDYTLPYRRKAEEAGLFIDTLFPKRYRDLIYKKINEQIEEYYAPNEDGFSCAYFDSLF